MPNYLATSVNTTYTIVEPAGAAIEDVRGQAVKFDDKGSVIPCVANDTPIGVGIPTNDTNIAAGADVHIQFRGIGVVKSGAAFAKGEGLAIDANGCYIKATSGTPVAIALQAAPAAGALIEAILK